jgi:hypothetical protein
MFACLFGAARSQDEAQFLVSYVSAEHVYIDAGKADGLHVGDRLGRIIDGKAVAELEVVYVALHSASCRQLEGAPPAAAGDALIIVDKAAVSDIETPPPVVTEPIEEMPMLEPEAPITVAPAVPVRMYGNASMILYHWADKSDANLDFTQTSARVNLRAENIWMEHLDFAVRTRGRYDVRNRAYSPGISETQWENRLWVLSLAYDNPKGPLAFSAGRFLPRRLGNIGYIDGAMVSAHLSDRFEMATFAGRRSKWAYNEDAPSMSKYGGYISYQSDLHDLLYFDQSIGMVGEFFEGYLSRSYIAWSGSFRQGQRWGASQSIELDINRGWRKDKAGESLTLSNLFLHSWLRVSRAIRLSVQYDTRQNYWTYQYLSQADSLFDDRVRQGFRGRLDLSPLRRTWLSGSIGYRKATGDSDASYSYSGSIRRAGFFGYNMSVSLMLSGFDGMYENGNSYSIRTSLPPGALGNLYASVGGYKYSVSNQSGSRSSRNYEIGTSFDFSSGYYVGGSSEWSTGDDIDGLRLQIELGYRY